MFFFQIQQKHTNLDPSEVGLDHWRSRLRGVVLADGERVPFVGGGRVDAQVAVATAVPRLYDVTEQADGEAAAAGDEPVPALHRRRHHGARVTEVIL